MESYSSLTCFMVLQMSLLPLHPSIWSTWNAQCKIRLKWLRRIATRKAKVPLQVKLGQFYKHSSNFKQGFCKLYFISNPCIRQSRGCSHCFTVTCDVSMLYGDNITICLQDQEWWFFRFWSQFDFLVSSL